MNRLTKEDLMNTINNTRCSGIRLVGKKMFVQMIKELCEYKTIEEELGIDLIKAVELCKQVNSKKVVYTKENWGIGTLEFLDDLDIELFNHRLYVSARGMYISLDLYEYGKTRSISREELEQ